MITKEILKSEIDRVKNEYLEPLYKIIKAFEASDIIKDQNLSNNNIETAANWQQFINSTYGCLSDAPIERGYQSKFEDREIFE